MRKAQKSDKDLAVKIITETFLDNPGVNWMLRKNGNRKKQIKRLAEYAFIHSQVRDGVFISSNEKGVALCYPYYVKKFSLLELYHEIIFLITSVPLLRIPEIIKREIYRKKIRGKNDNYFYFWFFAVTSDGENAGFELKHAVYDEAANANKPILVETAVRRNKLVYERMGCETYHYWVDKEKDIEYWFLKWVPEGVEDYFKRDYSENIR